MYTPNHFAAEDADALIGRLAPRRAGVLVTVDPDGTPVATHAPIMWDPAKQVATGHIARANPQWKQGPGRGLIVLGGAEAYVTPGWYPSKQQTGKTVPTWNYETVHLSGRVEWFDDPVQLEALVRALSARHEAGRVEPWVIEDAPRHYVDALLRGFIGFDLHADRVEAKRKLSQNKGGADFDGVADGLAASGEGLAQEVAALMRATRAMADDPDGN